ncbi:hypothetical protein PINS_up000155 [Pythium insidiosum]|nr:hypothetical protein PINS_up000155 [Pythium insidiosum]
MRMVAATGRNASAMALLPPIGSTFDGAGDDDANNALYKWIGLGIVVGSAILSNLGVNVQKLSHVRVRSCAGAGDDGDDVESDG